MLQIVLTRSGAKLRKRHERDKPKTWLDGHKKRPLGL